MTQTMSVSALLSTAPRENDAIAAPGRPPLTYGGLTEMVQETHAALRRVGIGKADRVAIVLPNGPHMAAAFVALASSVAVAPLNPAYTADEFRFYLTDLQPSALVVARGEDGPAVTVARELGIALLELCADEAGAAGSFRLDVEQAASLGEASCGEGFSGAADLALLLHTSGTTSRPKIVPLSHRNVCSSARNIAGTLALSASDRALNIMPLFHIHGLIAGLLAPLSMGGSVVCTPSFNALKFFGWMREAQPTWYTGVPTMHQAILARAAANADVIAGSRLRFVRSSSSSMPPQVIEALERTFSVPLIEAYGMTEASHQMTSNPLSGMRKPGSVGLPVGVAVAILGEDGAVLPAGAIGEVAIRGENVTRGYEANPDANRNAFSDGWFRTGDQGYLDDDGYLTLSGRLKEIINRGGEKISPREVDEVLMDHPGVAQVVTFAVPHEKLGEDVAAAVVLHKGASATEQEMRTFAQARLAAFKVPRRIVFLDEIPKGATGKLQRIGLAAKLGLGAG